ncbi:MAG: hypothetical protein GC160_18045 [Acidobacteria bacterium]|nr:hypothetical protein [Acidobacteriota bacterium]
MVLRLLLALLAGCLPLLAQAEYRVYNKHPRLFLDADRLKRLSRDAERETDRWRLLRQQLDNGAALPERPVALALAYQLRADERAGRQAVETIAAGSPTGPSPLRQAALAYDWCYPLLNDEQRAALARSLTEQAEQAPPTAEGLRDAVLALVAVAGDADGAEAALGRALRERWEAKLLPQLQAGGLVDRAESLLALLEVSHVLRHNLERDLWTEAPDAFRALPMARILGYLPETLESDEGRLRRYAVPVVSDEAAVNEALFGRIAEMLLVAYESTSREAQFLQGWLRNDSFTLKGPRGAIYEMLWINPYLPGLAPASAPKWTFDPVRGRIFAQRNELWLGYYDGGLHVDNGQGVQPAGESFREEPLGVEGATVIWTKGSGKWEVEIPTGRDPRGPAVLFLGLDPQRQYEAKAGKGSWRKLEVGHGGVATLLNDYEAKESALEYDEKVRVQLR